MATIAVLAIVTLTLGTFIIGYNFRAPIMIIEQKNPITGYVEYWVKRAGTDTWVLIDASSNLVVTQGLTRIRDKLGWDNSTTGVTSAISLSNDASSPAASWTVIPNELTGASAYGLYRQAGTVTRINSTAYQSAFTFTANGTVTARLSGLNWSTTQGASTLFAANTFTATTLYSADQLTITWTINCASG